MPKMTIYIPDELWEKARGLDSDLNPSRMVQAGLSLLIAGKQKPLGEPTPDQQEKTRAVAEAQRAGATDQFQDGYGQGLKLAGMAPWWLLDRAAQHGFDLEALENAVYGDGDGWDSQEEHDFWNSWYESGRGVLYVDGLQSALRNVWSTAVFGRGREETS